MPQSKILQTTFDLKDKEIIDVSIQPLLKGENNTPFIVEHNEKGFRFSSRYQLFTQSNLRENANGNNSVS